MSFLHALRDCLRFACFSLLLTAAVAQAKKNEEIDWLSVAQTLLRDGALDRAESALGNVDPAVEGVDVAHYWTVKGLLAMARNELPAAVEGFEKAIAAGAVEPLVQLYLAQAYFAQEQWPKAIATIEGAGPALADISAAWSMRVHANWMAGRKQQAMDVIREATLRFPANNTFTRRQIFYLIESGLYQDASRVAREFLTRSDVGADDYAAIGAALRRAKSFDEAKMILEAARLRYPDNDNIGKALAQTWLEDGKPLAAAELLGVVAERNPALLPEAAELYRRAGFPMRALALNQRITDTAKKLKQRVGILAELRRYEQIVGMRDALARARLLEDEDVRYALAYATFRGGDFAGAEVHLAALRRADLFRKATELRQIMNDCAAARWTCV
jgi:tetratricopeptide (TPR) repeat protein